MILTKRRFRGVLHSANGQPLRGAVIRMKLLRDVAAEGVFIPSGDVVEIVTGSTDETAGEYNVELYTRSDSHLNYRWKLDGAKPRIITVQPGGETTFDAIMGLALIEDVEAAAFALENLIAVHEMKPNPHSQYVEKVLNAESSIGVFDEFGRIADSNIKIVDNDFILDDEFLFLNQQRADERYFTKNQSDLKYVDADLWQTVLDELNDALAEKAAKHSPAFSGMPLAPTAILGTNTQQISTTAFVQAAITGLKNGVATEGDDLNKIWTKVQSINAIVGGSMPDANSTVDTVAEVLAVMATYPEGVKVLTAINSKLTAASNLSDLSSVSVARSNLGFSDDGDGDLFLSNDSTYKAIDLSSYATIVFAQNPANINQSANYRFTTDAEKTAWNAKQPALGFTAENIANKATDFSILNHTLYATVAAIETRIDLKIAALVDSSPEALNTLKEFAAALDNDPSFATTTATAIGARAVRANNLSDLTDVTIARANLGFVNDGDGTAFLASDFSYKTLTWTLITGKPVFATVATSGNYNSLSNLPNLALKANTSGGNFTGSVGVFSGTEIDLRFGIENVAEYRFGRNASNGLCHFYGTQGGNASGYIFDSVNGEILRMWGFQKAVGIGITTFPDAKLHVLNDNATVDAFIVQGAALQSAPLVNIKKFSGDYVFRVYDYGDIEVKTAGMGVLIYSDDGVRYRVKVANDGTVIAIAV